MNFEEMRYGMVRGQIIGRGIQDLRVIEAMRRVPRHEFVPESERHRAYEDCPIPIGEGQTISQPFMVALMTQSLNVTKREKVLEIGTGSGYQTAVLAELASEIHTFERIADLSDRAREVLQKLKYDNVHFYVGDGSRGVLSKDLLFDCVMVTAACPRPLDILFEALTSRGRMIIPIGDRSIQTLTLFTKERTKIIEKKICQCVFVPLIGQYGWN